MSKRDFSKRFRTGRRIRGQYCSLHYGPLETAEPKIAVVVRSKAVPLAVRRNAIRRALSEHIGGHIQDFTRPVFVVVIVHTQVSDDNMKQCREEITGMLKKSGIINS